MPSGVLFSLSVFMKSMNILVIRLRSLLLALSVEDVVFPSSTHAEAEQAPYKSEVLHLFGQICMLTAHKTVQ